MSTQTLTVSRNVARMAVETRHRLYLRLGYFLAIALIALLSVYGFNYYTLGPAERPFSSKHALLRPNGSVGLWLGVLGTTFFLIIFLYALRKHWTWLKRQGNARHWLDFHVLLGISAPFVIAFHAAFKFGGFAGMAFWIMVAVAVSGVIGRYLFAQVPRSLNAAELSLKEARDLEVELTDQLARQKVLSATDLAPLFDLPSSQRVHSEPMVVMLVSLIAIDLRRAFRIARIRRRALGFGGSLVTLGGLFHAENHELERVIAAARTQAGLSKRILFLSRTHKLFHLWHVIHRPFSYAFAVLAMVHILVVMLFGVR